MAEDSEPPIDWEQIKEALPSMTEVSGGYSTARRGIITLEPNRHVFVKLGVDDVTQQWSRREIRIYQFLRKHRYPWIPTLVATAGDGTGFALEMLGEADGWDWSDAWTADRLARTIEAMDALAAIRPTGTDNSFFAQPIIDQSDNGWRPLAGSAEHQQRLQAKLRAAGHDALADDLNVDALSRVSEQYVFRGDALVHNDVRADNAAWNRRTNEVNLVDWNWTQLGDRRIDMASMLVHVHRSGLDVLHTYASRLDPGALRWMAGYWLNSGIKPIWQGGQPQLRDQQLQAGVIALHLSTRV